MADFAILLIPVLAGLGLWLAHAKAWDLGRSSTVLDHDSSQTALAAREWAEHGRLATPFAFPLELARSARPPWPLALVQPGLVGAEAAIFRVVPKVIRIGDILVFNLQVPAQREWLTLLVPFFCYVTLGALLTLFTARLLWRYAPEAPPLERRLAALTIGLAFLLDPEAQRLSAGGYPDLPVALGLAFVFAGLASTRAAARQPLLFGLLLGVIGSFKAAMTGFVPVLALAVAALAPARRARIAALTLLGYGLALAPWWTYKWRAFGSPGWDLSQLVIWEGIQGRSWFSLVHQADPPALPHAAAAIPLVAAKITHRLPALVLALATGPRALWAGSLVLWVTLARRSQSLAVTAWSIVGTVAAGLLITAAGIPWPRYLFPVRVPLEAAGTLALWGLIASAPPALMGSRLRGAAKVLVAVLALGWGVGQTLRGNYEARSTAEARGMPSVLTLRDLNYRLRQRLAPGEVVMSNLGAPLAWYAGRPVLHLALSPADIGACRRRLEFRNVVLAFRDADQAWPAWREAIERPAEAVGHPEWNVVREHHWIELDGFLVVWLELGPPEAGLATVER